LTNNSDGQNANQTPKLHRLKAATQDIKNRTKQEQEASFSEQWNSLPLSPF